MTNTDSIKVAIVGCGKVGMSTAFALLLQGIANEIVLLGRCKDDIIGEQLDLEHGMAFLHATTISATESYSDLKDCDVVVITAGASQKPGETRLDLAAKNVSILEGIIPRVVANAPNAIILIVSNPVDVLTYKAYRLAGLPKGRVFGTGTSLDTARFRFHLAEFLKVNPRSIHAYILGEHGDSSFPVVSSAMVGGQPLMSFANFSQEKAEAAFELARSAAYKIIESKGSTYYGIAVVVAELIKNIVRDTRSIFPVSVPLHNYQGQHGVAISVPCIIGREGVVDTLDIKMSWDEKQKFERSATTIKKFL